MAFSDRIKQLPLVRLLRLFSRRRRLQFVGVFAFTLVGAVAELIGIGAVFPFLQLVAAPQSLARSHLARQALLLVHGQSLSDLVVPAAILLVAAAIVSAATRIVLTWMTFRYVNALTHDLSIMVFGRTLRLPYGLIVRRNSAEVLSGVEKVNYLGSYLLAPCMLGLSSALIAIGIVGLLLMVDPVTALAASGALGFAYFIIGLVNRPFLVRMGHRVAVLATDRIKLAQETMGGMRDIILDQSEAVFERPFRAMDAEIRRTGSRVSVIGAAPRYIIEALATILIVALVMVYRGRAGGVMGALPALGALAFGAQRLLPLLQNVSGAVTQYSSMIGMLDDVFLLLDAPVRTALPQPEPSRRKLFREAIELRDVGFRYGDDAPALTGVDLVIPRGSRVGLVGRTGSGKSTLLDLVMGLIEPTSGSLMVDGRPLDAATLGNWQAQIAHVPQVIFLTDSSLATNIAFGLDPADVDMVRVRDAAARADIADFIESLPEGYETRTGERGVRLSGGQRQRIGIARALYKQATVLVLDEATSALDDATEAAVMAGIERLSRDLTVLLIAHRLSTVRLCDMVVRLEEGRVAAVGTYAELIDPSHRADAGLEEAGGGA